jgi:hypothetical protein
MLNSLPPRFFCDFTIPVRADETPILSCRDSADYELYVRWLSEYLYATDLPLSPDQQDWLLNQRPDAGKVIFECSDTYGYALFQLETMSSLFEDGVSYADYRASSLASYNDPEELSPELRDEISFDDWVGCSEAVYDRLAREYWQDNAAGEKPSHADVPFRSLLAWAIHQILDAEERYEKMDWFFTNFSENASK